jgi:hypothetical protein
MPYEVFTKLVHHPLTDLGLQRFQADWAKLQEELRPGSEANARATLDAP